MSDEFITIATKEINDEIADLENILNSSENDDVIYQNAIRFQFVSIISRGTIMSFTIIFDC